MGASTSRRVTAASERALLPPSSCGPRWGSRRGTRARRVRPRAGPSCRSPGVNDVARKLSSGWLDHGDVTATGPERVRRVALTAARCAGTSRCATVCAARGERRARRSSESEQQRRGGGAARVSRHRARLGARGVRRAVIGASHASLLLFSPDDSTPWARALDGECIIGAPSTVGPVDDEDSDDDAIGGNWQRRHDAPTTSTGRRDGDVNGDDGDDERPRGCCVGIHAWR